MLSSDGGGEWVLLLDVDVDVDVDVDGFGNCVGVVVDMIRLFDFANCKLQDTVDETKNTEQIHCVVGTLLYCHLRHL